LTPHLGPIPQVPATRLAALAKRVLRWTDWLFLGTAALFSAVYLTAIALQVLYRYALELPSPWTEEMARYLFIWSAFLAAAVSVGRDDQFLIPLFIDMLPPRPRRLLHIFIDLLQLTFAVIMVRFGSIMSERMMMARSPVLPMPQGVAYLVIPIAGAYMAVHLICRLLIPGLRTEREVHEPDMSV
jgi:TRAP-type C4-dicarboxylate transport system permease small subunit